MRVHRSRARTGKRPTLIVITLAVAALAVSANTSGATSPSPQGDRWEAARGHIAGGALKPSSTMLEARLYQLAEIERRDGAAAARRFAAANEIRLDARGRAEVLIHQRVDRDRRESSAVGDDPEQRIGRASWGEEVLFDLLEVPIRERVVRLGGAIGGRAGNVVDAAVPINSLRDLDDGFAIGWVESAPARRLNVVSEGVDLVGASELQQSPVAFGAPGDPVRVGVLDIGFKDYESLLGDELPAEVTVNSFHPGGIEGDGEALLDQVHGTACAEIIFDMMPEAELYLANFNNVSDNADAIDWMIEQGVDVISYSVGWFNAGPGDGRGVINDPVQRALDAGIEFVVSAGNDARAHWQGQFRDNNGDGLHDFAPGDSDNSVFLRAGEELVVFLSWDDWFNSNQDYDLYVIDDLGNIVASSASAQTGGQNPTEALGFAAPATRTYHVVIDRFRASRAVNLEMFYFSPRELQYVVPAGSVTIPADTEDAVAVGATYWGDDVIEFFSSQGPTTDGRIKPDLVAPDGVATVSFGNLGFGFFGTSASAPHVAGAIALMKSRFGVFTLPQLREILYGRAIDQGVAGKDNTYGFGRLDVVGR